MKGRTNDWRSRALTLEDLRSTGKTRTAAGLDGSTRSLVQSWGLDFTLCPRDCHDARLKQTFPCLKHLACPSPRANTRIQDKDELHLCLPTLDPGSSFSPGPSNTKVLMMLLPVSWWFGPLLLGMTPLSAARQPGWGGWLIH